MSISSYEEERMARIAENQKLMNSLGLDKTPVVQTPSKTNQRAPRNARSEQHDAAAMLPIRRSTRKTNSGHLISLPDDWKEDEAMESRPARRARYAEVGDNACEGERDGDRTPNQAGGIHESESLLKDRKPRAKAVPTGPPDSSRNLVAEVDLLRSVLGERVPGGHIKAGVMNFVSPKVVPRFSKYVGVQEWINTVFLMFNVIAGNHYGNTFIKTKTGMQVTYFLSERTASEAPIVSRLQRAASSGPLLGEAAKLLADDVKQEPQEDSDSHGRQQVAGKRPRGARVKVEKCEGDGGGVKIEKGEGGDEACEDCDGSSDSVHLFCRPAPESFKKLNLAHADYVYLGRLGYVRSDVSKVPIEFVFELLDYPTLAAAQEFKDLLALAKS